MGKTGFIDLEGNGDGNKTVPVYIFESRATGYSYEKTVEVSSDNATAAGLDGIEEFSLGLPLNLLNFRVLGLPFSDRQKLKGVIPFELDGLILGGSGNIVFDFVVLGEAGNGFDVLVVYIEKKSLRDILAKLAALGIDPRVVTSIDLRHVLETGRDDLGPHLMNPDSLSGEGRRDAAMKEVAAPTLNLRTGPFAYIKDEETARKKVRTTAMLVLLLALLINADLAFRFISAKRDAATLKKEMRSMYTSLFPEDRKITDEVYQTKSHLKELREKGDLLTGVSPLRIMKDLSQKTMPGVKFDEVSIDRDLVTMKGEAAAMDRVDAMKTGLSEFLTDVTVSDIKTSADGKIRFTAVARGYKQGSQT